MGAGVDADLRELGVQHSMPVGSSRLSIVNEHAHHCVSGDLIGKSVGQGPVTEHQILSSPPVGLPILGDPVEGARLVRAEMTNETLGSDIVAVSLCGQVESFVPFEGRQLSVLQFIQHCDSVLDGTGLLGRYHALTGGEVGLELRGVRSQFVLPVVNGAVEVDILSSDNRAQLFVRYRHLFISKHRILPFQLLDSFLALRVDVELVSVQDGRHHGTALMRACRDTRELVGGLEEDLAGGARSNAIVDDELHNYVQALVGDAVSKILPLGRASAAVTGDPGAWVAPI